MFLDAVIHTEEEEEEEEREERKEKKNKKKIIPFISGNAYIFKTMYFFHL